MAAVPFADEGGVLEVLGPDADDEVARHVLALQPPANAVVERQIAEGGPQTSLLERRGQKVHTG